MCKSLQLNVYSIIILDYILYKDRDNLTRKKIRKNGQWKAKLNVKEYIYIFIYKCTYLYMHM